MWARMNDLMQDAGLSPWDSFLLYLFSWNWRRSQNPSIFEGNFHVVFTLLGKAHVIL